MVGYSCELVGQIAYLPDVAAETIGLTCLHFWSNHGALRVRKHESKVLCDHGSRLEGDNAIQTTDAPHLEGI